MGEAPDLAEGDLQVLVSMGFDKEIAWKGLQLNDYNAERAIEWLCDHEYDTV